MLVASQCECETTTVCPPVGPTSRPPPTSPSLLCYVACNKFRVEKNFIYKRNYKISPPLNCVAFLLRCALVAFQQRAAGGGVRKGLCWNLHTNWNANRKTEQAQKAAARNATLKRLPRVALARFKFNMQDGVEVPLALGRNCGELRAGERGRAWGRGKQREQTR